MGIHLVARTRILLPVTPVIEMLPAFLNFLHVGSMVPKMSELIMDTSAAESSCASLEMLPMKMLQ